MTKLILKTLQSLRSISSSKSIEIYIRAEYPTEDWDWARYRLKGKIIK